MPTWTVYGYKYGNPRDDKQFVSMIMPARDPRELLGFVGRGITRGGGSVQKGVNQEPSQPGGLFCSGELSYSSQRPGSGGKVSMRCLAYPGEDNRTVLNLNFADTSFPAWLDGPSEGVVAITLFNVSQFLHSQLRLPREPGWRCMHGDFMQNQTIPVGGGIFIATEGMRAGR
jgi:hypothetical protein